MNTESKSTTAIDDKILADLYRADVIAEFLAAQAAKKEAEAKIRKLENEAKKAALLEKFEAQDTSIPSDVRAFYAAFKKVVEAKALIGLSYRVSHTSIVFEWSPMLADKFVDRVKDLELSGDLKLSGREFYLVTNAVRSHKKGGTLRLTSKGARIMPLSRA